MATLNGEISFWNPDAATQTGSVVGRHDLETGRKDTDKISAKQLAKCKWVTPRLRLFLVPCVFSEPNPSVPRLLRVQVLHVAVLLGRRRLASGGRPVQVRVHLQRQGTDAHEEVRDLLQPVLRCHGGTVAERCCFAGFVPVPCKRGP